MANVSLIEKQDSWLAVAKCMKNIFGRWHFNKARSQWFASLPQILLFYRCCLHHVLGENNFLISLMKQWWQVFGNVFISDALSVDSIAFCLAFFWVAFIKWVKGKSFHRSSSIKTLSTIYFINFWANWWKIIGSQCDINFSMLILANQFFELVIYYSVSFSHPHVQ